MWSWIARGRPWQYILWRVPWRSLHCGALLRIVDSTMCLRVLGEENCWAFFVICNTHCVCSIVVGVQLETTLHCRARIVEQYWPSIARIILFRIVEVCKDQFVEHCKDLWRRDILALWPRSRALGKSSAGRRWRWGARDICINIPHYTHVCVHIYISDTQLHHRYLY